ncbi:MAG: dNTP triphosphohydrolase [Deinococcaceae bacterium]
MAAFAFDWFNSQDIERRYPSDEHQKGDLRNAYERDRARIIHSSAFRRLQGKSQIFTPGWAGSLRTRVTHAMEVAQIARSIATNAGLPGALAEAAALAHDLGHPPFGHNGEEALNRCMQTYGGFEGNAQTFRILTRLEPMYVRCCGMNLTRSTLLGALKYPTQFDAQSSKFIYTEDALAYEAWLYQNTHFHFQRLNDNENPAPQSIICQIMDWADDVAYSVHDLDDGLAMGFLDPHTFERRVFLERLWKRVQSEAPELNISFDQVREVMSKFSRALDSEHTLFPRTQQIRETIASYVHHFVTSCRVVGNDPKNVFECRLQVPLDVRCECAIFKGITQEFVLFDQRTAVFSRKAVKMITELFECLLDNALGKEGERFSLFPDPLRQTLLNTEEEQALARHVCDFLADMTDAQASHFHERLFSSTPSMLFEPL